MKTEPLDELTLLMWDQHLDDVAIRVPLTYALLRDIEAGVADLDPDDRVRTDRAAEGAATVHRVTVPDRYAGVGIFPAGDGATGEAMEAGPVSRLTFMHTQGPRVEWEGTLTDRAYLTEAGWAPFPQHLRSWHVSPMKLALAGLLLAPRSAVPEALARLADLSEHRAVRALMDGADLYTTRGEPAGLRDLAPLLTEADIERFLVSSRRGIRQAMITRLPDLRERLGAESVSAGARCPDRSR